MPRESDRISELEDEVARLMEEVDRYRTAAEDAMQQLDWCIGYFAGANKARLAQGLGANRSHIRRQLMRRSAEELPVKQS